jgi:hypothetical protein
MNTASWECHVLDSAFGSGDTSTWPADLRLVLQGTDLRLWQDEQAFRHAQGLRLRWPSNPVSDRVWDALPEPALSSWRGSRRVQEVQATPAEWTRKFGVEALHAALDCPIVRRSDQGRQMAAACARISLPPCDALPGVFLRQARSDWCTVLTACGPRRALALGRARRRFAASRSDVQLWCAVGVSEWVQRWARELQGLAARRPKTHAFPEHGLLSWNAAVGAAGGRFVATACRVTGVPDFPAALHFRIEPRVGHLDAGISFGDTRGLVHVPRDAEWLSRPLTPCVWDLGGDVATVPRHKFTAERLQPPAQHVLPRDNEVWFD